MNLIPVSIPVRALVCNAKNSGISTRMLGPRTYGIGSKRQGNAVLVLLDERGRFDHAWAVGSGLRHLTTLRAVRTHLGL